MLKNLKNAEWSKKITVFIALLIIATYILVVIATFMGLVDALVALVTGVFGLATMACGFYFWKAKNENIRKYAKGLTPEQVKKVVKIYDSIFKEDNEP